MDFDASWCISCDRLIEPKRYQVPIPPPPQESPAPPPSSPQSRKSKATLRRGGLVHGTGRIRPNGTIKADLTPPSPPPPTRYRTVIDQSPQGVYCSDECRMADLNSVHAGLPVHPDRAAHSAQPGPPPARAHCTASSSSSDSSESEDPESPNANVRQYPPAILRTAKHHGFPLPDLSKIYISDSSDSECYNGPNEYTGGMIMAGRRVQAACPKPRAVPTSRWDPVEPPPRQIPGWTDGSQAWRAAAYNVGPLAYRYCRRPRLSPQPVVADPTPELMANFSECLTRRTESRISSLPSSVSLAPKRERSLLLPGAEGKLLVPDVKLKVRSSSSSSISSGWKSTASSKRSVRSPLSTSSEESATSFPLRSKRPAPETRSWSYDNVKTYPLMPLPTTTVRRKEIQIIDGKEVEVVVEYQKPPQRLFLFPCQVRS